MTNITYLRLSRCSLIFLPTGFMKKDKSVYISLALSTLKKNGFTEITPVEINDGVNLIIHLAPYPIAARIATALSEEYPDTAYRIQERELQVASHLQGRNVPVLLPSDLINPGPYDIGGTWMTLWRFESRAQLPRPIPEEAVGLIDKLSNAMKDFPGELPSLGPWEWTCKSADRLGNHKDERVQALLGIFQKVNTELRVDKDLLIACHGDANLGNLFPSNNGWIWMDFEDVSKMPPYWDLASFICIPALFRGVQEPTLKYVIDRFENKSESRAFGLALIARTLTSTLGNLDYALRGFCDLDFAIQELGLAEDFINQIDFLSGEDIIN